MCKKNGRSQVRVNLIIANIEIVKNFKVLKRFFKILLNFQAKISQNVSLAGFTTKYT